MRHARFSLVVPCLLASQLLACPEPPPEAEVVIRPVRYEVAHATTESATRTFSGVARAGLESSLSFRVAGNVEAVAVQVGNDVQAGDLIAQLDTSDYEVALQAAQADSAAARARQRNAEADYERVRQLYESGAAPRSDLDAARAASESAQAQVSASRQNVQRARDQVEYCTLSSPVAGQIAAVNIEVNENVQAGQPVVMLTSGAGDQLEVEVPIPETVIARIRQGQSASVAFNALSGRALPATVTEVGVAVARAGTSYPVTVTLGAPDPDVRSGMAASVTFTFEDVDTQPRYWLRADAVTEDTHGRYLFVVVPHEDDPALGTIERREVTIGALDNRGLEITSGLEDGDRVVTAGVSRITAGMTVRVPPGPESAAPGTPGDEDSLAEEPTPVAPPADDGAGPPGDDGPAGGPGPGEGE